jgi:hypothetical protein
MPFFGRMARTCKTQQREGQSENAGSHGRACNACTKQSSARDQSQADAATYRPPSKATSDPRSDQESEKLVKSLAARVVRLYGVKTPRLLMSG